MINWNNIRYELSSAERDFANLKVGVKTIEPINVKDEFKVLRNSLIAIRDNLFENHNFDNIEKLDYEFDLLFGLKLYSVLNEKVGFNNRVASNDDVWRYLSICMVPDIVHARWGLKADHYYKMPRRIWLKKIWWFIHLSWMGDEESTYDILKTKTTDTILQLVERPGIGYNIPLYREIMKQYDLYEDKDRKLFRKVLILNTMRIVTTSPELSEGGIEGYVAGLFKDAQIVKEEVLYVIDR